MRNLSAICRSDDRLGIFGGEIESSSILTISSQFSPKLQTGGSTPIQLIYGRPMLKLIYTEAALYIELLTSDVEDWVEQRLLFANSTQERIFVSSEKATFLVPELICEASAVNIYLHHQGVNTVTVIPCDLDQVEIGLTGYWLSNDVDNAEGIFVTQLPDQVESYLWQLWSNANNPLGVRL